MKVQINRTLKNFRGEPLMLPTNNGKGMPAVVKDLILEALGNVRAKDESTMAAMLALGRKIQHSEQDIELDEEARNVIRQAVTAMFPTPFIAGQICELLTEKPKLAPVK